MKDTKAKEDVSVEPVDTGSEITNKYNLSVELSDVADVVDSGAVTPETVESFTIDKETNVGPGTISRAYVALKSGGSFYVKKGLGVTAYLGAYGMKKENESGQYWRYTKT